MDGTGGLYAVALGAGLLASVNPCGFALLPAYLSLLVLGRPGDAPVGRAVAVRRALVLTAAMTTGFVAVFAVFGLVVAPVASGVQQYLPWVTLLLGVALAVLGAWLAAGRSLPAVPPLRLPRRGGSTGGPRPLNRSPLSMLGFGVGYALASLSCTVAPFLAVVVTGFRVDSAWVGLGLFVAYAAGMGLVVGTLAVATALAAGVVRGGAVAGLRGAGSALSRAGGVLLLLAGAYVAWYAVWEVRVLGLLGDTGDPAAAGVDPVVGAAEVIQRSVAGAVSAIGAVGWVALAGGLAVALLAGRSVARHRAARDGGAARIHSAAAPTTSPRDR